MKIKNTRKQTLQPLIVFWTRISSTMISKISILVLTSFMNGLMKQRLRSSLLSLAKSGSAVEMFALSLTQHLPGTKRLPTKSLKKKFLSASWLKVSLTSTQNTTLTEWVWFHYENTFSLITEMQLFFLFSICSSYLFAQRCT